MDWFKPDRDRYTDLATSWVTPEPRRCVQCGTCSFHCPMGIDVRRHVWQDEPVSDGRCLTCGECVKRCPHGLLGFEPIAAAAAGPTGFSAAAAGPIAAAAAGSTGFSAASAEPARIAAPAAGARAARRHLLVGRGAGVMAAAETIRAQDRGAEITVVGADPHGFYSRPGLAYHLAKEVPEKGLFPFSPQDMARLDVRPISERAAGIDLAGHRVTLESGRELPYDRLLIATGSAAIPTRVPGGELNGVVKLDHMDDARDLLRRCRRAKAAVVVGGGITALEIVEGLRAHGVHVHYFLRKDRYWANVLSESESRIVEQRLQREQVEIHRYTELVRILGKGGRVTGVETADGTRIRCDLVAVAIGVRPQIEIAAAAGLACGRGILVDQYLRSSDEHVFAAGDVAEVCDAVTGHRTLEVLWNSAVNKGRIAGLNMAGEPVHVYAEGTPLNVTRLAGLHTTIIGTVGSGDDADLEGLARGDSQIWSELCAAAIVEAQKGDAHIRLALDKGTIVGAVVMGDQALSFPLQELVEGHADISGIVAALEAPGAPVVELVNTAWRDWKASAGRQASVERQATLDRQAGRV